MIIKLDERTGKVLRVIDDPAELRKEMKARERDFMVKLKSVSNTMWRLPRSKIKVGRSPVKFSGDRFKPGIELSISHDDRKSLKGYKGSLEEMGIQLSVEEAKELAEKLLRRIKSLSAGRV